MASERLHGVAAGYATGRLIVTLSEILRQFGSELSKTALPGAWEDEP
jgi:hypothetical protein